jgi:hypothetical protein
MSVYKDSVLKAVLEMVNVSITNANANQDSLEMIAVLKHV